MNIVCLYVYTMSCDEFGQTASHFAREKWANASMEAWDFKDPQLFIEV